jgi:predicted nucleic acid-binding Zn ribbon protein
METVAENVMTCQQLREYLRHGDVSLIARRTGRTVGHVSQVLSGKRPDRKVAVALARRIRVRLEQLPSQLYAA